MTAPIAVSEAVRDAIGSGGAVVALETSVLAQGVPPPRNLEAAERMSRAIADGGATPAWTAVRDGSVRVGLHRAELEELAVRGAASKVARRDLPVAVARRFLGATTVSATIWAAHRAGILVVATGGIGGVHPGSHDVSADLAELAETPVLLVCSGPKSIVDQAATAERLEALGVAVVGYRCDRLPSFLAREGLVVLEHRVDDPAAAAALVRAQRALGTPSAILLCNPVPPEAAMDPTTVTEALDACRQRAVREGIRGKDVTPYLLGCLAERTGGASLETNLALLVANAALAADVAVALATGLGPR